MVFSLSACNFHGRLYSNDTTLADETMAKIAYCINKNDTDELIKLFSKKALKSIDNYDKKINAIAAKLRSGIKIYKLEAGPAGSGSYMYGQSTESFDVGYMVRTNSGNEYNIGFNKIYTSTENEDLLGLTSLRLSKSENAFVCTNDFVIFIE